jgi:CTP synthase
LNITGYSDPELGKWKEFLDKLKYPKSKVSIGLIGKYIELQDAYKSILESFIHAGAMNECKVEIINVHSEFITQDNVGEKLAGLDGLLVAPGFGHRGVEGKIVAVKFARENGLPFLKEAHSTEMDPDTKEPVIDLMEEQKKVTAKGGTMRLGAYPCTLQEGSLAAKIYGTETISERHRHRWEFNNNYLDRFEKAGMKASGKNPGTGLVEIIELPAHPFFIGVQYHPELKSTVENPQPIFVHFVKAAKAFAEKKIEVKNPLLQSEMI